MKNADDTMSIKPPRTDMNQGSQATNQVTGTAGSGSTRASTSSKAGAGSDTVTFTNTVAEMLKLEESLAKIPDINDARVEAIKASIAEGNYQIDSEKIVDSLLKLEKDLK